MDLWLVTRKPIGLIEDASEKVRNCFYDDRPFPYRAAQLTFWVSS
jgi:hypothetical protein